jgi:hypothetical protein
MSSVSGEFACSPAMATMMLGPHGWKSFEPRNEAEVELASKMASQTIAAAQST